MLNIQRTFIFCVLFAAVWVQSTKADLNEKEKNDIKYLEHSLNYVKENKVMIPQNGIDHFKSWESWKNIDDAEKLRIALDFRMKLFLPGHNSEILAAYEALDDRIKYWVGILARPELLKVVKEGRFLEYMAVHNLSTESKSLK